MLRTQLYRGVSTLNFEALSTIIYIRGAEVVGNAGDEKEVKIWGYGIGAGFAVGEPFCEQEDAETVVEDWGGEDCSCVVEDFVV